jgi:hypothetical protein
MLRATNTARLPHREGRIDDENDERTGRLDCRLDPGARRPPRAEPSKFSIDDLVRVASLTDLDLSPDGEYVVYSVGEPDFKSDKPRYDLWRARWDGSGKRPLTAHGRRR